MEESSEKRRERLRAMREEAASLGNTEEERGRPCIAISPEPAVLPLPNDIQQPTPYSPSPRFEFYTDPLAAFSGSQRKKKPKHSLGVSPFGGVSGSPAAPPCKSPPSPFWQPDVNVDLRSPGNFNSPGYGNVNANLPSPGRFSTSGPSSTNYSHGHGFNPRSNPNSGMGRFFHGSFNSPFSNTNQSNTTSSRFFPSTPGSAEFNPMVTPQAGCSSNPTPSMYGQQPLSASQVHDCAGSGGSSLKTPPLFSSDLSPRPSCSGSVNHPHHNRWSHGGMSSSWSQGSNRSQQGSLTQSPGGSNGRDNRTPGRSGGRGGFHRNQNEPSAVTNPELFARRSMLVDPWKDLVPVRIESVASRLNSCSVAGSSQDWLPKSVNKGMEPPNFKGVTISPSGPSLAESLAASFADAVAGEGTTEL